MKNTFFTLVFTLIGLINFAQDTTNTSTTNATSFNIKDYSLRDYIAPDIKYRTLAVGSVLGGEGAQSGKYSSNDFNGNANIRLYSYRNLQGYQGSSNTGFQARYYGRSSKYDTNYKHSYSSPVFFIDHRSVNRWYNLNDRFIGIHPLLTADYGYVANNTNGDTLNPGYNSSRQNANVSVIMSVGTGRIQPVTAARRAMDIMISLQKYNRLAKNPTNEQIDSLAKVANTIAFKRFYDSRFKRVYQLAELDSGIQSMGLVDNPDMIYAANLSDIWNYGRTYYRGSGSRFEFGVIPVANYANRERNDGSFDSRSLTTGVGISGFVSWTKRLPINYQWQSDFSIMTTYGVSETDHESFNINQLNASYQSNTQTLSANWNVGYYPNTRTWIQMSPYVKFSAMQMNGQFDNQEPEEEEFFGMESGIDIQAYYYLSPRFRLGLRGGTSFISDRYIDFDDDTRLTVSNQQYSNNNATNVSGQNRFRYNYRFTLSYAIF